MITDPATQPLVINWERLHQISDGDGEFEVELLQMLSDDLAEQMIVLQDALAQKDSMALKHLAHYLKGATANLGLTVMSRLALQIEEAAKTEQLDSTKSLITALQDQHHQLVAYLERN